VVQSSDWHGRLESDTFGKDPPLITAIGCPSGGSFIFSEIYIFSLLVCCR
jgi:hypothetical protein